MKKLPLARSNQIAVQNAGDEMLIYDLEINRAIWLNATAALVYRQCDGQTAAADFIAENNFTDELMLLTLDKLRENRLLEHELQPALFLKGINRRELIKRIGLTSMVLLPAVLTAVAPTAAQAASGVAATCFNSNLPSCTNDAQCAFNEVCENNCCLSPAIDGGGSTTGGGTGTGGCGIFGC